MDELEKPCLDCQSRFLSGFQWNDCCNFKASGNLWLCWSRWAAAPNHSGVNFFINKKIRLFLKPSITGIHVQTNNFKWRISQEQASSTTQKVGTAFGFAEVHSWCVCIDYRCEDKKVVELRGDISASASVPLYRSWLENSENPDNYPPPPPPQIFNHSFRMLIWRYHYEDSCYISIRFSYFLLEPSREIVMGSELWRWVLWVWIMEDEVSEHSTNFCWKDACQLHTAQNIMGSRGWKKSKDC